jgi:2-succinyl-6-hydroxy-2,4-cyclohexadiene-1-carboxylate synthase
MRDIRINVGSIELQVREYEREGDALFFLHFGGANLVMWQGVVPYFQDEYRLILVDLRGHGKSDKPQTGYHIDEMAHDVSGVMARLGIERAHIVGSSLGAEVGLSLAANEPEKVISLVCEGALYSEYGPYGVWEGSEAEFKAHVARKLEERRNAAEPVFASVDALVDDRRQAFERYGWWNEKVEALTRYDACEIDGGEYTASWRKHAQLDYLEHYFEYRFEDYYQRVKCPVLMVPDEEGAQDERMKTVMKKLSELAGAEIVALPGWVHPYGWMLNPEGMSKVVLEFLARVRN